MACLQRNKNGQRCSKQACMEDAIHPGYCKFHIKRFMENKDIPNPVALAGAGGPAPIPEARPRLQAVAMPRLPILEAFPLALNVRGQDDINPEIENRIRNFINLHRRAFINQLAGRNPQERDNIVFDYILTLPVPEQNFLIENYDLLLDIIEEDLGIQAQPARVLVQGGDQDAINQFLEAFRLVNVMADRLHGREPRANAAVAAAPRQEQARPRNLGEFVADMQNVHTKEIVDPVIKNAKMLMKLGKKKSKEQDTFKEVVFECKLSGPARKQLCFMYYSDEKIYNLQEKTYQLVLDGVWYYVLKQKPETKAEIITRLSQELEDNIGMCAQGNLSRIINTLSGYMEELIVEYEESLQDGMARISKIADEKKRINEAKNFLKKKKVPENEWEVWLESLSEL